MTNYVPNHRKKVRIFEQREDELRHAIRHGFSAEKVERAAERLRQAKFAVFKSKFARSTVVPSSHFSLEKAAAQNPVVKKWAEMTTNDIVAEYSKDQSENGRIHEMKRIGSL